MVWLGPYEAVSEFKTVRIEIDTATTKVTVPQAASWIQQACGHGKKVIATYHNKDKLGSNNRSDLMDAAKWEPILVLFSLRPAHMWCKRRVTP